jgi:hypothetical protein
MLGLGCVRQVSSVTTRKVPPSGRSMSACARTMGVCGLSLVLYGGKIDHETPSHSAMTFLPGLSRSVISYVT